MKLIFYFLLFISDPAFSQNQKLPDFTPQIQSLLDSGIAKIKAGQHAEGFAYYDKALQLDSMNNILLEVIGSWEGHLKYFDRALKTALLQLKLAPQNAEYQLRVGCYFLRLGDSINAQQYFVETIRLSYKILDTITTEDKHRLLRVKLVNALATVFNGNEVLGNKQLLELYNNEAEQDEAIFIYVNKSKNELLNAWSGE